MSLRLSATFTDIRHRINYYLGGVFRAFGYHVVRDDRVPRGNLNLLEMTFYAYRACRSDSVQVVQIGAFDGERGDYLENILNDPQVEALLVEPQLAPFETLRRKYSKNTRVRLENSAIGRTNGIGKLYVPKKRGVSSSASFLPHHLKKFGVREISEIDVPVITPRHLIEKHHLKKVDILQIDTEGLDFCILKEFFNININPDIINMETYHLSSLCRIELRVMLRKKGYIYRDYNHDTLAVLMEVVENMKKEKV